MTKVMTRLNKNIKQKTVAQANTTTRTRGSNLLNSTQVKYASLKKLKDGRVKRTFTDGLGLHLYIKDDNKKVWEFNFVSPVTEKRRKTTFGFYPDVSLSAARAKRQEYRELVAQGIDPIEHKKQKQLQKRNEEFGDFETITMEWLNQKLAFEEIQQITYDKRLAMYKYDLFRVFEGKNIAEIKNVQIARLLKQKAKTAPSRAARLFDDLRSIFRFALSIGYLNHNIFGSMSKHDLVPREKPKHYPKITKKKVLKELVDAIYSYKGGVTIRNALKLVLHAPLRMVNLRNLLWSEVDFKNQRIVIARAKMKTKDINLEDFELPLSDEACSILKSQYKISKGCAYVFQNPGDKNPINPESINRALERMGFNDESRGRRIRVHGFRGTYRSMIETLDKKDKFSFVAKELVLDHHESSKAVRAYTHKAKQAKKVRKIMKFWSEYILSLKSA